MRGVSILLVVLVAGGACASPAIARERPDPMQMLEKADSNRDGKVTRGEFLEARRARFATMDRNGDGCFDEDDLGRLARRRGGDRIRNLTAALDADRDGRLCRSEFVDGPTRLFDRADRNGDGVLDADERAALAAVAARR